MAPLTKLKGSLKDFYTQLTINGKQDKADQPSVISHIIKTLFRDRLRDIYKQRKEQLLETHRTPFKSLVGLVDSQILLINVKMLLEHMNAVPVSEELLENDLIASRIVLHLSCLHIASCLLRWESF